MIDFPIALAVLAGLFVLSFAAKMANVLSLVADLPRPTFETLLVARDRIGFALLAAVLFVFLAAQSGMPVSSDMPRCAAPPSTPYLISAGPDPIFVSFSPSDGMLHSMTTFALTIDLETNVSLSSRPATHDDTFAAIKALIPRVNEAVVALLSRNEMNLKLAESMFLLWEQPVDTVSSQLTVADWLNSLSVSLSLMQDTTDYTLAHLTSLQTAVWELGTAYVKIAGEAWEEELRLSAQIRRRWIRSSIDAQNQLALKRYIRLHSTSAACAFDLALDALCDMRSAVCALHRISAHVNASSAAGLHVALGTLQQRAAALREANLRLAAMFAK